MHLKKYDWDVNEILRQLSSLSRQCSSPYNDGFTAWGLKQDLHTIKFHLDECLKNCPEFADEQQWLDEQEKKKLIKILKE